METAYINYCLAGDPKNLYIARLGHHNVVINQNTMRDVMQRMTSGQGFGRPTLSDAIRLKLNWEQRSARSYLKRQAIAKAITRDVPKLLKNFDVSAFEYLNVGHSNLTVRFLSALKARDCQKVSVLIHDMIPLDYPEYSRANTPAVFEKRMRAVAKYADRIICNSDDTRGRVAKYFTAWGASPEYCVSHLGIEPMIAVPDSKPPINRPYYVVLGTIEPRKNHLLLFRVWERMEAELSPEEMPYLFVVGRRGWDNIEAFQFLDESLLAGKYVFEKQDMDDADLANLLSYSNALLFPSFVEGFGLPALEAAQLQVPVICTDLATFHEILHESAKYLNPTSPEEWRAEIRKNLDKADQRQGNVPSISDCVIIPTWESHFRHIFS